MGRVLLCFILLNGGFAYSQLLSTVRNVHLVDHTTYMLKVVETVMKDMETYEWCNLKVPGFTKEVDEEVFDLHVKGRVTFSEAFLTSVQNVDVVQHTVQQIWRFDNLNNTTSVFVQANVRLLEITLGYDVHFESEDGSHHYYTASFKHNMAEFPFAVIYNMFTEEFTATVTMNNMARSTNKLVFAPSNTLSQVLSHEYDVTSAGPGMAAWGTNVFQPILLDVAKHKVPFPNICYNCAI